MTDKQGVIPDSPQDVETVTPEVQEETHEEASSQSSKPPKGFVPYEALREERTKTELLEQSLAEREQELSEIKSSLAPEEEDPKFSALSKQVKELQEERELDSVIAQNPLLKELRSELQEFRTKEHPRAKIASVAKVFLAEKGLLEPTRQGLERPTGGDRTPAKTGLTNDEVAELRKTNYRKYMELVKSGALKEV